MEGLSKQEKQDIRREAEAERKAERKRRRTNPTDREVIVDIADDVASIKNSMNWILALVFISVGIGILGSCGTALLGF